MYGLPPSLKLSVSVIINDTEKVSVDLQRAYAGDMKRVNNSIDPLNIQ
jgi:hypothetical protein